MVVEALQLEVDKHVHKIHYMRYKQSYALVVRNGKARQQTLTLGAGMVKIWAPGAHDLRMGRFTGRILPP